MEVLALFIGVFIGGIIFLFVDRIYNFFKTEYIENTLLNIKEFARENLQKIDKEDMIMGKGLFNRRCHENAVQYSLENNDCEVYVCLCVTNDNNYPYIHFINKIDDKFVDNTLGWEYVENEYYIISKINQFDRLNIVNIFSSYRKDIIQQHANKFFIKLFDMKDIV